MVLSSFVVKIIMTWAVYKFRNNIAPYLPQWTWQKNKMWDAEILERNYVGVDKGAAGHYYIYMHCIKDKDRGHKQC